MSYVIVEIRGGIADVDAVDVTSFVIDWDEVGDNWAYAESKLDDLVNVDAELPPADAQRIYDAIAEIWPVEYADYLERNKEN